MSNVPCYRLQTFIWHIRGVTWRRKSLNTCREAPLCAERFQSHRFPGCSVVPCPVARSMCSHMWQSSGPVPWHHRGRRMALLQHVCDMEVVPGKLSRRGELKGSFAVLCYWLICIDVINPLCQSSMSSVLLLSIAVSSVSLDLSRADSGPFVEG